MQITDKELIYLSVLIKIKMKTLGDSEEEKWKKHNFRIIRKFIDMIINRRIDTYIDTIKKEIQDTDIYKKYI
jgi:hypothetical protein